MNVVVCPYHSGEVIVQNYNAILTLGHLSVASDAVLFMENEHVSRATLGPACGRVGVRGVGLSDARKCCHWAGEQDMY
jgi:tubulin delta